MTGQRKTPGKGPGVFMTKRGINLPALMKVLVP
jgi:hypothetical protein